MGISTHDIKARALRRTLHAGRAQRHRVIAAERGTLRLTRTSTREVLQDAASISGHRPIRYAAGGYLICRARAATAAIIGQLPNTAYRVDDLRFPR